MNDRIEKQVELSANLSRVWSALTDSQEFGSWFRVKLEGRFIVNQTISGHITYPGYEHLKWECKVVAMEPEKRFAFTWHPYAINPQVDYAKEQPTLVEFKLEPRDSGTHLTLIESGFCGLPKERQTEALRMNDGGWTEQMKNIAVYLS
jgi:uncharacterized protein YndB with AHSA1/START domain